MALILLGLLKPRKKGVPGVYEINIAGALDSHLSLWLNAHSSHKFSKFTESALLLEMRTAYS